MISKPYFKLIYKGVDITSDLDPMATDITYHDNHHGEVDEIEVTVQDSDGLWKGAWKPEVGDIMSLTIYDGFGGVLPCGEFELDEPEAQGSRSGDTMTIRGLAAPITKSLRTEKTRTFEKQNLQAIVSKVADEAGLSLEGKIDNLKFEVLRQRRERDLEFLTRLAEDTGHYFTVKGTRAVFTNFQSVDSQSPALKVFHGDRRLISYSLKEQTSDTYSKAQATSLDPDKKKLIKQQVVDSDVKTGDILKIAGERIESDGNAKALAKSRLHFKNRKKRSGSIDLVGTAKAVAGATVKMSGFGKYSGKYLFDKTSHTMSRGGYTVSGELLDAS